MLEIPVLFQFVAIGRFGNFKTTFGIIFLFGKIEKKLKRAGKGPKLHHLKGFWVYFAKMFCSFVHMPTTVQVRGGAYSNSMQNANGFTREALLRGRISTIDLLVLTNLDQLLSILKLYFSVFTHQPIFNEEVNCTEPSPSVRVPWRY